MPWPGFAAAIAAAERACAGSERPKDGVLASLHSAGGDIDELNWFL